MADPRFWISLGLSGLLHVFGFGGVCAIWFLMHLGAGRVETAPVLMEPYGDSDADGMKVATVSMNSGALKESTENTPGGSGDEDQPYRPTVATPVVRPQESEDPPEPVIVPEPKPTVEPEEVSVPQPEPKPAPTKPKTEEPKKPVTGETRVGEKSAGAPGGASLKSGTPSAGGRAGVSSGVRAMAGYEKLQYPKEAIPYRMQGLVTLKLTVSAEGRVIAVELVQTSGHKFLDESALRQAPSLRFYPKMEEGQPVETTVKQTLDFVYPWH